MYLVFNLANNIDEEESLKKVEELKKEAKESAKNKNRVTINFNSFLCYLVNFFKFKDCL